MSTTGLCRISSWLACRCCYVPLPTSSRKGHPVCLPDVNHDCEHDVFTDVFARWDAGHLKPDSLKG